MHLFTERQSQLYPKLFFRTKVIISDMCALLQEVRAEK